MSAPLAADVQTSPAQVHGAKVINYFGLSKRRAIFLRFLTRRINAEHWTSGGLTRGGIREH